MTPAQPALIDSGPSPAGWSRVSKALRCLREYGLTYGAREVVDRGGQRVHAPVAGHPKMRASSEAQVEGTVLHTGLAHYYALLGIEQSGEVLAGDEVYTDPAEILDPHAAMRMQAARSAKESGIQVNVARLSECLEAYKHTYRHDQYRVLGAEVLVRALMTDPERRNPDGTPKQYLYTSRVDLIVESAGYRESDRRIFFVDHKGFSGQSIAPTSPTITGYSVSGQITGLRWLGQQTLGEKFGGVVINMIQRQHPYKMGRPQLAGAPRLLQRFEQTVIDAERRIADAEAGGVDPSNWTPTQNDTVCVTRYGVCSAWENNLCQW